MTLPTKRHVHVLTSNHAVVCLVSCTEGKTSILFAQFADRGQFLNLLALGDKGQNFGEGSSEECALKRRDHYNFAEAGSLLRKLYNVSEKLALVNSNNIVGLPLVTKLG